MGQSEKPEGGYVISRDVPAPTTGCSIDGCAGKNTPSVCAHTTTTKLEGNHLLNPSLNTGENFGAQMHLRGV